MKFERINRFFIFKYKLIGVALLLLCALAVVLYAFLFLFFTFNRSWAAPVTLSPSQERVLAARPQVTMLEAGLDKTKIELNTAKAQVINKQQQINQVKALLSRIHGALRAETKTLAATSREIEHVWKEQSHIVASSKQLLDTADHLEVSIKSELSAGLITKDQAASRYFSVQATRAAAVAAHTQSVQLATQAQQLSDAAGTLSGGATSIQATQTLYQEQQLRSLLAQLEIDLITASGMVDALTKTVADAEHVLAVARTSAYHQAMDRVIYLGFIPYGNFSGVRVGALVYDCALQVIWCKKVGTVTVIYDPEEYARHPLFRTDLKGRMVELELEESTAASSQVVFIGGKPLLL